MLALGQKPLARVLEKFFMVFTLGKLTPVLAARKDSVNNTTPIK
jgi:hypothetical protein